MRMKLLLLNIFVVLVLVSCTSNLTTEEYIAEASAYVSNKDWKKAIIQYKNAIKQSSENAEVRYLLSKVYLEVYNSLAAEKEIIKAIDLGLDKDKALIVLGKSYELQNKNNEIINEIIVRESQTNLQKTIVLSLRSNAFLKIKKFDLALSELNKAKLYDDKTPEIRLSWAMYESIAGTVDKQLFWLKPLLSENNVDALSQKGKLEADRENFIESEEAFTKAISIRKIVHIDNLSRALVRISLKKYSKAKDDLSLMSKAGYNAPVVLHSEGVIAFYEKDYELAQKKFNLVLSKFNSYPPSLFVLGLTYYQKNSLESAINVLEKYLEFSPNNEQAKTVLATSYLKTNKVQEAIDTFEVLYRKDKNNASVASMLGQAYVQSGDVNKAIRLLEESARLNPNKANAQFQLGSVLIRDKNNVKKGQSALLKAIKLEPNLTQANISLFLSYMQTRNYNEATEVAQKLIDKSPEEPLAYNLLGNAYLANGNSIKADQIFHSTLKKFPSHPLTSFNVARLLLQNNDLAGAKAIYLNVLDKYPSNHKALMSLAVVEEKLGNSDSKMKYLEKAVELNNKILAPKIILASEYLKLNEFKKAGDTLRELDEEEKSRLDVQLLTASIKIGFKDYPFALNILKKLVVKHPNSSSAHFLLAKTYGFLKNEESMRRSLNNVLRINPDYLAAKLILVKLALFNNKSEEFEYRIKHLIKLYPNHPEVKFLHAKLESNDENYQSAISTLEGLLKETSSSEIIIELAKNKWSLGSKEEAITGLELWLEKNTSDTRVLMLLGQYFIAQNRFEEANEIYSKIDKLLPNNPLILNNMAWLYKDSDVKRGVELARKSLSLDPNNALIKDTLAILLLNDNQLKEALKFSKEAASVLPKAIEIQLNYADILIANNELVKAKILLNSLLVKPHSNDQRKNIQKTLESL